MIDRIQRFATQRIGPLVAWQWFMIVTVLAVLVLYFRNRRSTPPEVTHSTDNLVRDPVTGEFKSAQSTESIDPKTGERRTSSYEASGSLGGLVYPGNIGFAAYPAPYSGGDIYVNLPGDTKNMNPAQPATTTVHFPPKKAPGPQRGQYGGYWWTPRTLMDAAQFEARSVPGLNPGNYVPNRMRIIAANPQIDWTKGDFRALVGQALYIPPGTIGGIDSSFDENPWPLPPGASLNAPASYNPPAQQQTTVSVPT